MGNLARNFKFGTLIDLGKSHLTDDKILPEVAWWGSRAEFLNSGATSLNLEVCLTQDQALAER